MNKQIKYIYSFLFKPSDIKERIKQILYLFIFISIIFMFVFFALTEFNIKNKEVSVLISLMFLMPFFYSFAILRIWLEVFKKETNMKITLGMTRKEYLRGTMFTMSSITFILNSLLMEIIFKGTGNANVILITIFTSFFDIFIFTIMIGIATKLKNIYVIYFTFALSLVILLITAYINYINIFEMNLSFNIAIFLTGSILIILLNEYILTISSRNSLVGWFDYASEDFNNNAQARNYIFYKFMLFLTKIY